MLWHVLDLDQISLVEGQVSGVSGSHEGFRRENLVGDGSQVSRRDAGLVVQSGSQCFIAHVLLPCMIEACG